MKRKQVRGLKKLYGMTERLLLLHGALPGVGLRCKWSEAVMHGMMSSM